MCQATGQWQATSRLGKTPMVMMTRAAPTEAQTGPAAKPIRVSSKWVAQALTFLMVFSPGLIVIEAANNAGAVFHLCPRGSSIRHASPLALTAIAADLLLRPGDGSAPWDRDWARSRHHDLPAVREVVGSVLAGRSAAGQFSHAGDRVRPPSHWHWIRWAFSRCLV